MFISSLGLNSKYFKNTFLSILKIAFNKSISNILLLLIVNCDDFFNEPNELNVLGLLLLYFFLIDILRLDFNSLVDLTRLENPPLKYSVKVSLLII